MALNEHSKAITEGDQRAPNRAMLRAVGFGDADFTKPIVGIANGYSTITPCNAGLDVLAHRAEAAVRAGGGMPQIFGTVTVSDGISMGTEGMKYSLVSREVIADSIETACGAQSMDGVLAVGGCDKNMPGAMIAMARMKIPAVFVYGGTIKPGHHAGRDLTVVSVFEAVGQHAAGNLPRAEFEAVERKACPGAGSCGGMFTANTMSSVFEAMGMSLPGSSTMAAEDAEKAESAAASADALLECIRRGITARQILTREAFENGIAVCMALGGSTNAVLHLLAIAHAAEVPLELDDFERIRARVPVLCDLKPSGRFVATDLHQAGGVPAVMKLLLEHGVLHGHCLTVTGKTLAENIAEAAELTRGSGGNSPVGPAAVRRGAPRRAARQPGTRWGGGKDQWSEEPTHAGTGAGVRVGRGVPRRDPRGPGSRRRYPCHPERGPCRGAWHARNAGANLGDHWGGTG